MKLREKVRENVIRFLMENGEYDGCGYRQYINDVCVGYNGKAYDVLFIQATPTEVKGDTYIALEVFLSNDDDSEQFFYGFEDLNDAQVIGVLANLIESKDEAKKPIESHAEETFKAEVSSVFKITFTSTYDCTDEDDADSLREYHYQKAKEMLEDMQNGCDLKDMKVEAEWESSRASPINATEEQTTNFYK